MQCLYVCALLLAIQRSPPFVHSLLILPSPLCFGALTVFLWVSVSSAVAPVPCLPNLLPLQPSPLLSLSPSLVLHASQSTVCYLPPCSLSVLCIVLSAFLHSHRASLRLHISFSSYCLLLSALWLFFFLFNPPPSRPLLFLHIWKHRPHYWLPSQ